MVKNHGQKECKGSNENVAGENQPEPRPILYLPGKFTNRYDGEELRCKHGKELSNGIVFAGAPYVRGVFVVNAKEVISVPQRDESQLRHEQLIQHNEKHQKQQSGRSGKDSFVGKLMMSEENHQKRDGQDQPVMVIETDDIQLFGSLIRLGNRLLGIKNSNQTADNANIEHVILDIFVFGEKKEGEQGDVRAADIDKPTVPEHSRFVNRVGRDVYLQKVKQKAKGQKTK